MIKLKSILLEDWEDEKKTPDKLFTTYFVSYIVKFKKSLNKNEIIERIRGIKNVTIVEIKRPEKLASWSRKSKEYEYNQVDIKFNTNISPKDEIEKIRFSMLRSKKEDDIFFIDGIVAAKPLMDTFKTLD